VAEAHIEAILDRLFDGSEEVIESLGKRFTFEQFRKKITQRNQVAYIDLLVACRDYQQPFGQAHWFIGSRLRPIMYDKGFTREEIGKEFNIFGGHSDKIVYTRMQGD
jgi:hypothetical protein